MIDPHELDTRLDAAFTEVAPSDEARARALAAMLLAMEGEPAKAPARSWSREHRGLLGLVAATLALGPTAALAETAVPGDALYPVKRVVEQVQSVFDRDAAANNRVDEAARLLDRLAADRAAQEQARQLEREQALLRALAEARDAVSTRATDAPVRVEYDRVQALAQSEIDRREAIRREEERRRRLAAEREAAATRTDPAPDDTATREPAPAAPPDARPSDEPTSRPTSESSPEPTRAPTDEPTREPEPDRTREPEPDRTREPEPDRTREPTSDAAGSDQVR